MNLNVEKVDFIRPRVDASVRYLKKIAMLENAMLDTPTAYEIIQNSGCDMRRALIQLQMRVVTAPGKEINSTTHGIYEYIIKRTNKIFKKNTLSIDF